MPVAIFAGTNDQLGTLDNLVNEANTLVERSRQGYAVFQQRLNDMNAKLFVHVDKHVANLPIFKINSAQSLGRTPEEKQKASDLISRECYSFHSPR